MDRREAGRAIRVAVPPADAVAAPLLEASPYDFGSAAVLARELGLSRPTAVALIRRGIVDVDSARHFLAGDELRPPTDLPGVSEARDRIQAAIAAGERITVFGDFDVDGVCATSILIGALRKLGAQCDWLIPDRLNEGYGLRSAAVERLAARGTRLIITVDCGITAVEEVELARRLGLDVIVTDHHRQAEDLPDCLIVHPGVSGYSCPSLCGAAVAWKLATALAESAGVKAGGEEDLDLVALATVADLVPLTGENRSLVKRGLTVARRASRLGLRELMKVAGCLPAGLDEGDLGFLLGPRVNAVGRLYRADAGVELFLSDDEARARAVAEELDRANRERRKTEQIVVGEAERSLREARGDDGEQPAGIVVSGPDWHPGVIGIVASRLVEMHGRPAVVISIDSGGSGNARGSGRGVPGFDLLAALRECEDLLGRYGGHRAAAGLELKVADIPAFATAFASAVEARLGAEPVRRAERVDAFAGGPELGLELAEELEQLAPFGIGNPGVNLVIPSARVGESRPMGADGSHLRFTVFSGGYRARAVAFGRSSLGCDGEECADLVIRLERNEWNGSIEPRLRLREVIPVGRPGADTGYMSQCGDREWWKRFNRVFEDGQLENLGGDAPSPNGLDSGLAGAPTASLERHAPGTGLAVLAEMLSSGARVLAVSVDAGKRAELAFGAGGVARFNRGTTAVCSFRDGVERFRETLDADFGLTDYRSLLVHADGSEPSTEPLHIALIDPPASRVEQMAVQALAASDGTVHSLWDEPARAYALAELPDARSLRSSIADAYRALRAAGSADEAQLRAVLEGGGPLRRSPESAGLYAGVLSELGLVEFGPAEPDTGARRLGVVSSKKTDLENSKLFQHSRALYEVKTKFLESNR